MFSVINTNRGRFSNLLVGAAIALLPLYVRIHTVDIQRTSKDNLLVVLFVFLGFMLPSKARNAGVYLLTVMAYAFFAMIINQHNVLSLNVVMQVIYITSALSFFIHYYEKHDRSSLEYVFNGMRIGCIIQCVLGIFGFFAINLYPHFVSLFAYFNVSSFVQGGFNNVIGSLGNSNLLASYVALTGISFLNSQKKWLIIFPIVCLSLAQSFMGASAFIAGVLYYYNSQYNFISKAKIYLTAIAGMLLLPVLSQYINTNVDSGRFDAWKKILSVVDLKHLLLGKGPGWFPDQMFIVAEGVFFQQEHNSFLSLFNIFGIVGFLLLLPIFINFLKQKDHTPMMAATLFAAFCNAYGHFILNQSTCVIIIVVCLAVCLPSGVRNGINVQR